jgi:hypothetical protein
MIAPLQNQQTDQTFVSVNQKIATDFVGLLTTSDEICRWKFVQIAALALPEKAR